MSFYNRADDVKRCLSAVGMEDYSYSHPELYIPNKGDLFAPGMGARIKDNTR